MRQNNGKRKSIVFYLLTALVTGTAASVAFSFAAYMYNHRYDTPVEFNTGTMTSYFAGGTGTESSPYSITTADHLRNLQKLTVLGVFGVNTYFRLDSAITWSGNPLFPIGTEDNPFYSQFLGNGKTITSLAVEGSNTNDVGMFGYVARGSNVKDFILSAPTISIKKNTDGGIKSTTNPLSTLLSDPTTGAPSLGLTYTHKSGSTPSYFQATKSSLSVSGVTYGITYKSTDTSLLNYQNNRWEVIAPLNPGTETKFPVQLSATVYAIYDRQVISHTAERWHINVNKDGTVDRASGDVKIGYWKTIHDTLSQGYGVHGTYVGLFIGHLDGDAKHLGLYGGTSNNQSTNGKIIVEGRGATSFSSLIGRTLNDNVSDAANAKFNRIFFNYNEFQQAATYTAPARLTGTPTKAQVDAFFTQTNTMMGNVSAFYGLDTNEQKYIRIYPTAQQKQLTYVSDLLDEYGNPINETSYTYTIKKELIAYTNMKKEFLFGFMPYAIAVNNGLWVYLSAEVASGFAAIFSETGYEAYIKIRYVINSYTPSGTVNYFRILANSMKSSHSWLSSAVGTELWDLIPDYAYSSYPIVQKDAGNNPIVGKVVEYEIPFTISKTGGWSSLFGGSRQPMIGIGVGGPTRVTENYIGNGDNRVATTTFNSSAFEMNILTFDIFFSSLEGSLTRQMSSVDYINNAPTFNASNGTWSNWNKESGVRVHFNVEQSLLTGSSSAIYRYYRASGTNGAVYVYQTGLPTGNDTWKAKNTDGFKAANIYEG